MSTTIFESKLIKNKVGEYIYVWSKVKGKSSTKCVITAHGGAKHIQWVNDQNSTWKPTFHLFGPEGYILNDAGILFYASSEASGNHTRSFDKMQDYALTKYTNSKRNLGVGDKKCHNNVGENYDDIALLGKSEV